MGYLSIVGQPLARLLFTPFAAVKIHTECELPRTGACIVACNHISHFDPPLVGGHAWRYVEWMAMQELFERRWAAMMLRSLRAFPVNRDGSDRQALRVALRRLQEGRVVGIFPEGGIRAGAESVLNGAPMRPGIALLSTLSGAPIVPAVCIGSDRLYNKKSWAPGPRVPVWISFGTPLHPNADLARDAARIDLRERLAQAFRRLFDELVTREALSPADLPQTPQARKG